MVLRALHLCSGFGGFELALRLAGVDTVTVAHVERDAYAAATLVARMESAELDQAPIWSDLHTFDGMGLRGRVDLVTAGFPCQPFSAAGNLLGTDDERWLWPAIRRVVCDVGPRYLFVENVPGLVRHGLPHVLSDLAELGWRAEWGLLSAAEVGAPHRRERLWLLADADGLGRVPRDRPGPRPSRREPHAQGHGPEALADTDSDGREEERRRDAVRRDPHRRRGQALADADSARREGSGLRRHQPAQQRDPFPPGRDDDAGWERWRAAGGPEPAVRRSADGRPEWLADALHLGGNGLVPAVAAHALLELARRLGVDLNEES